MATSSNPVIRDLIARSVGRPGPLHIGLDFDEYCFVIDGNGKRSPYLVAVRPLKRRRFF